MKVFNFILFIVELAGIVVASALHDWIPLGLFVIAIMLNRMFAELEWSLENVDLKLRKWSRKELNKLRFIQHTSMAI